MFLRSTKRKKDGKEHRYWSVVENVRHASGPVHQKTLLYLGDLNDSQHAGSADERRSLAGDEPLHATGQSRRAVAGATENETA
jgi:hypothetical protein